MSSSSTWSSMKNSVLDQSGNLQSRGSNNVRKECCEWSGVTCRNEKTSSVQVYNCQTLNLQGGVEMQSREGNNLRKKLENQVEQFQDRKRKTEGGGYDGAAGEVVLMKKKKKKKKRPHDHTYEAAAERSMLPHWPDQLCNAIPANFKDQVSEARTRCFQALAYVTALEQRIYAYQAAEEP